MVGTHHGQPNTSIAGASFYDQGVSVDLAGLQGPLNDGDTGTILGATPGIQPFQFGETAKM
jgi:hypothetical protein